MLKPQAPEGQDVLRAFFRRLVGVNRSVVSMLAANVLTRMQLTRLAREAQLDFGFGDLPSSTPPLRSR